MKRIDLETFPRRSHFEFFKSYAYPYMGITANVDVTNLYAAAKKLGGSPFLGFLWAAATAANAVPELRQRIVDDGIVEYDHCDTAHTVALPDGTFVNCRTDCRRSFAQFQSYGKRCQEEAKGRHGFVQPGEDETSLIFVSSTPWIAFTQVIQPTPIPADSNVRIVFGKFFEQNGRKMLPVNIQCNHALVDGLHVAEFFRKFQELADSDLEKQDTAKPDSAMDYGKYPTFASLAGFPSGSAVEQEQQPARDDNAWRNNVLRSDEIPTGIEKGNEYPVFGSRYLRNQIKSVTFLDTLAGMPVEAWDVSESGNRSVMAWVKSNGEMYDLHIGAQGGVCTGKSCKQMFSYYVNAERIHFGGALHTENTEDMGHMFSRCTSVTELDLRGFDTANVRQMGSMFSGCKSMKIVDLSSFDTSGVQNMRFMFSGCKSLAALDLRSFNTSSVRDMGWMFDRCESLTKLNLRSFDTAKVKRMNNMFESCGSLTSLDLSSFNTADVQNMNSMFGSCYSLTSLDLSGFDTTNVQDMTFMFTYCKSLTSLNLRSFHTANVKSMDYMFSHCESLAALDLRSFDMDNVQGKESMFNDCKSLTALELRGFPTADIRNSDYVFCGSVDSLVVWSYLHS